MHRAPNRWCGLQGSQWEEAEDEGEGEAGEEVK